LRKRAEAQSYIGYGLMKHEGPRLILANEIALRHQIDSAKHRASIVRQRIAGSRSGKMQLDFLLGVAAGKTRLNTFSTIGPE
jgi:hypothetical protein